MPYVPLASMNRSHFDSLIVIRFYNESLQEHHSWVTDSVSRARKIVESLKEDSHISDVTVTNALCK